MTEMEVRFIELDEFRNAMQRERERGMDFLREIVGMDWGEEGLGAIYILENSNTRENTEIGVRTTEREKPQIPTVSDIWQVAELYEREVFDFFGIEFTGHHDLRRLFLRNDWVGHPLRKDYDASETLNPIRLESEPAE